MKQSTYVSKRLFIFMIMIIIGSLGAGCNACKKGEKKEDKEDKKDKEDNNNDVVITDAMLESVEAAIKARWLGKNYNFLLDVLKNLKEKKPVDINATDAIGNTALIYAANVENADIVKVLIKKGADVNKKSKYSSFPLTQAALQGNTQVVQVLLSTPGIDVNAADIGEQTALYVAAEWAYKDIVLLLLNTKGIDINKVHNDGSTLRTALNIATYKKTNLGSSNPAKAAIYDEIIAELVKKGRNP